ncbi:MAG: nickel pincer cofactor biosynthesis protein LarB [Candidatus Altiarchaeota archaeon]
MIAKPDLNREERCGIPEVIYGESKNKEDLLAIAKELLERTGRAIATKVDRDKALFMAEGLKGQGVSTSYSQRARVFTARKKNYRTRKSGVVGVLAAGTSDIPIAEEAKIILEELGCIVISEYDVGISGLHRIFPALDKMKKVSVLVVVAGMEGALPSVVSGLVKVPVIGVPTSVGYGFGGKGVAALQTMLNSCSPVAVVNIDNGYGAAMLAYKIAVKHK